MIKLYRLSNSTNEYWESWQDAPGTFLVHWGELGDQGQTKQITSGFLSSAEKRMLKEADGMLAQGFVPISPEEHACLMIEYVVDGFGTPADLEKRHRLEDRMNETLGWTGLGACDGGSIGSGTMEVCSFVVDFETAKTMVENDLTGTEFGDYQRIYREDLD